MELNWNFKWNAIELLKLGYFIYVAIVCFSPFFRLATTHDPLQLHQWKRRTRSNTRRLRGTLRKSLFLSFINWSFVFWAYSWKEVCSPHKHSYDVENWYIKFFFFAFFALFHSYTSSAIQFDQPYNCCILPKTIFQKNPTVWFCLKRVFFSSFPQAVAKKRRPFRNMTSAYTVLLQLCKPELRPLHRS